MEVQALFEPRSPRWRRSIDLLAAVLPSTAPAYEDAKSHSGTTFVLFDRWMAYDCSEVLERGEPDPSIRSSAESRDWSALGRLLTLPFEGQKHTGLPLIKALLLVGFALGRSETQLMESLSNGARKAARLDAWRKLLPPALGSRPTLSDALVHCRLHVETRLRAPTGMSKQEISWLEALQRWCELLSQPGHEFKRISHLGRAVEVGMPDAQTSAEGDVGSNTLTYIEDESEDKNFVDDDVDAGERSLLESHAPEAPSRIAQALPRGRDLLETAAGAEARRARIGFRSALENQHLPWVNAQLVPDDCAALVMELRFALGLNAHGAPTVVGLLALAHVTGQLVEQAVEISLEPRSDASYIDGAHSVMRRVPVYPDAWKPNDYQSRFMRPKATHIRLDLPEEVTAWLKHHIPQGAQGSLGEALGITGAAAVAGAREWLHGVRKRTGGMQTLGRVEWWLTNALYQACHDHVPPHFMCSTNDSLPCSSAYYRAYQVKKLTALHRSVLVAVGWTMSDALDQQDGLNAGWVGSNLNPTVETIAVQWTALTKHLEATVNDTARPLYERHNARECHEVMLLLFQTLHRAVSDPVESLEYIDLHGRRMVIADKQHGNTGTHRVIPLSSLATRQCEEHIEHVRRLASVLGSTAPQTAARLVAVLERPQQRAAPFRFLLDEHYDIVRMVPSRLLEGVAPVWLVPLNLARHFVSTWLLEKGVSDHALCSFLGHHDVGTHNISLFSPVKFEGLFAEVRRRLDDLVLELNLRSIPTFLAPAASHENRGAGVTPYGQICFGHRWREQIRGRRLLTVQREIDDLIMQQLAGRPMEALTEEDVTVLFAHVREASKAHRDQTSERVQALRDALLAILRCHKELSLELPSIALAIRDLKPQCPMQGLAAAQWLRCFRKALRNFWISEFNAWRAQRTSGRTMSPQALVLTLVVDSLVIDPKVWKIWAAGDRRLDVFVDDTSAAWLRAKLPGNNFRLYPIRRGLAEMAAGVPEQAWRDLSLESVPRLANAIAQQRATLPTLGCFQELLARVQAASAADAPGLVLGYADGSHGSVSAHMACIEREGGCPPTVASVSVGTKLIPTASDGYPVVKATPRPPKANGRLTDEAQFRRHMSQAMRALHRCVALGSHARGACELQDSAGVTPGIGTSGHRLGPLKRFLRAVEGQADDLMYSDALPRMCGLAAQWIYSLARDGQRDGSDYAPKTLRNYWYSWALRVIEDFGPIDPVQLSAAEIEELYLQIVEDAAVENRQHLYPPMRNLHRYLVAHHGVSEINWAALGQATGQGQVHVNANLLHEHEYFRALDLLRNDEAVSARVRGLQAAVLVLLYRFGLRIAECLGLCDGDVVFNEKRQRWSVTVRANQYRALKTENARRRVVQLEIFDTREDEVLKAWALHVGHYVAQYGEQPLFASGMGLQQRLDLFPRQLVTLRVGQALHAASGDPSLRIHHCRHSFATRILSLGLEHDVDGQAACVARGRDGSGLLLELASETSPSRRFVWAVAAALGHASPTTTLQTYFHGGHRLLRSWCLSSVWAPDDDVDAAQWFAFACGTSLKTMQRAAQRSRSLSNTGGDPATAAPPYWAIRNWSQLPLIGQGERTKLAAILPRLAVMEPLDAFNSVDQIIDHVRRFGRTDGLAQRLFVSEEWIQHVIQAAAAFAARHRTKRTPARQWWIEGSDVSYRHHDLVQVHQALKRLQEIDQAELDTACALLERYLVPSSRMVVVEHPDALERLFGLARVLVDDETNIELLLPAESVPRLRGPGHRSRAEQIAAQRAPRQQSAPCRKCVDLEAVAALRDKAVQLGVRVRVHGGVAAARGGSHNWLRPSARAGLSLRMNATDCLRSARTFTRVLAVAAVAWRAQQGSKAFRIDAVP